MSIVKTPPPPVKPVTEFAASYYCLWCGKTGEIGQLCIPVQR